jgi:hypothetical protein
MATEQLAGLLFESSDIIPEGLYLQLMNLSRDIFKEKQQVKVEIKYRDMRDDFKAFSEYYDNPFETGLIDVGDSFEVQSPYRNKRINYRITKKNNMSFRISIYEFELLQTEGGDFYVKRNDIAKDKYHKWENLKDLMIPETAISGGRRVIFNDLIRITNANTAKELDLKCVSSWITDVEAKKYFSCHNFSY